MNYSTAVHQRFQQAVSCFSEGQHDQANNLCHQVLANQPDHCDALHLLGVIHLRNGRNAEAIHWLQRARDSDLTQAEIHVNLGNARLAVREFETAIASFDQALSLQPDHVSAWNNRGHALLSLSRPEEALFCFERALSIQPTHVRALNNMGTALLRLQRAEEAMAPLQQALQLAPNYAEALCNLGMVHAVQRQYEQALPCFDRALELKPNLVDALLGRAELHGAYRRVSAALADYGRALQLEPDNPRALSNAGNSLMALGRINEALACYDACLRATPGNPAALANRGNALTHLRRFDEALVCFDQALALAPDFPAALNNRASLSHMLGRLDETHEYVERLYAADPQFPYIHGTVLNFRLQKCDWRDYDLLCGQVDANLSAGRLTIVPFSFLAVGDSPEQQLRCGQIHTQDQCSESAPGRPAKARADRIRVAYVSSDLRSHAVSYLMAGVFREHDRSRFDITALALQQPEESPFSRKLVASFDRFAVVQHLEDRQIAQAIRELDIDIAVDLMGYTLFSRPGIFASRPAPVQIQHLGFPGTMGASFIDYLIADEFLIPQNERAHYQEQLIFMPHCFQSNDDQRSIAPIPTRAQAGLPDDAFVFCSFNASYKINPPVFATWMRLLREIPGSVLWLVAANDATPINLCRAAAEHGVDAERLIFAPRMPYAEHLARLTLADLFLDTLPFNAGATASDALCAGVPVLTCPGKTFAARMAGSLLHALNMDELIAGSWQDYEIRALELARNPATLAQWRAKLERQRTHQPLFDTRGHTRELEYAYETAYERAARGEPPATFHVPVIA